MEGIRNLPGVVSAPAVHDRAAGGRGDGGAFRRALQEDRSEDGTAREHEQPAPPMRTGLQPRPPAGRRDDGTTLRHIDVLA